MRDTSKTASAKSAGVKKSAALQERIYKKGTLLFIEGDAGEDMYVVRSGKIRLLRQEGETTVVAAVAGPGSVIGEMSLLNRELRTCTAQVVEDAMVVPIDRKAYESTLGNIPSWLSGALQSLVYRLVETLRQGGDDMVRKNIAGVSRLLFLMGEGEGKREGVVVTLQLARVKELLYSITGLSDPEIENVFLHLILKQMIGIGRDAGDQEYLSIKKPDVLNLYYEYLRAKQKGEKFPGEEVPLPVFDCIGYLLAAKGLPEASRQRNAIETTVEELGRQWQLKGKSDSDIANAIESMVAAGLVTKEADGRMRCDAGQLRRFHLCGTWLPVFKEDVKL